MAFIKTPLRYGNDSDIVRDISDRVAMIDNFIELVVFSPRGSFAVDPDFGFEYWNHEYSNVHFRDFNNGQNTTFVNGMYNEVTQKECKESIEKSLQTYVPELKQVNVLIELKSVADDAGTGKKVSSKYQVTIKVSGMLDDGLGIFLPYRKDISFWMEPTVKRIRI